MSRSTGGVIFTIDALIALGAAVIVLAAIFSSLQSASTETEAALSAERLHLAALDIGAVAESDGILQDAILGDNASLQQYLDDIPVPFCAEVELADDSGAGIDILRTSGCSLPDSFEETGVARRIVASPGDAYLVRVRAWYR